MKECLQCTDIFDERCRVRAQIIQHVSSLTLPVVGQQFQKLWGCLLPFTTFRFWSWNLNKTKDIFKNKFLILCKGKQYFKGIFYYSLTTRKRLLMLGWWLVKVSLPGRPAGSRVLPGQRRPSRSAGSHVPALTAVWRHASKGDPSSPWRPQTVHHCSEQQCCLSSACLCQSWKEAHFLFYLEELNKNCVLWSSQNNSSMGRGGGGAYRLRASRLGCTLFSESVILSRLQSASRSSFWYCRHSFSLQETLGWAT